MPWHLLDAVLQAFELTKSESSTAPAASSPTNGGTTSAKELTVVHRLAEALKAGLARNLLQRVPHLTLLSDAFYAHSLKPILADWLLLWLRKQGLRDVTDEQALRCLSGGAVDATVQAALTDRHVKLLNLGSD